MALTEFYVDPSIAGGSGAGTKADPDSNVQRCLDLRDHPASGGSRINIKAGATDGEYEIAAALDLDTGGTGYLQTNLTSTSNPLFLQGYTTDENDKGIGKISGANSFTILDDVAQDSIIFKDMRLFNVGNNFILRLDNFIAFINCELDGSTSTGTNIELGTGCEIIGSLLHDMNGTVVNSASIIIYKCRFIDDGVSNSFTLAISGIAATNSSITENIIWLDTIAAEGIRHDGRSLVANNSIFQNAIGTGDGIEAFTGSKELAVVANNLIEGFSGTGGHGIKFSSSKPSAGFGNGVRNCSTPYKDESVNYTNFDNETLSASPFTNGAGKDFSPVNTGGVKEGSQPPKIGLFTEP